MIEPKIDDLLAAVDSKYSLVIVAKRAREINSYYNQLGEGRGEFVPPLVETGFSNKHSIALGDRRWEDRLRATRGARGRVATPSPAAGCCSASPATSPRTRRRWSPACSTEPEPASPC